MEAVLPTPLPQLSIGNSSVLTNKEEEKRGEEGVGGWRGRERRVERETPPYWTPLPLAVGNMGDKDGGRGGGWGGGGRGYEGQVYLKVFLPGFVYHKESHAGHLLLVVLNQNTYSPAFCRLSPVEPSGPTDDSHALVTPRPTGGIAARILQVSAQLCPPLGDICLSISCQMLAADSRVKVGNTQERRQNWNICFQKFM